MRRLSGLLRLSINTFDRNLTLEDEAAHDLEDEEEPEEVESAHHCEEDRGQVDVRGEVSELSLVGSLCEEEVDDLG